MKELLRIMIMSAKAKVMPLWTKLRLWTSPTFVRAQVLTKIRQFFSKLLDVRPRHSKDYYGVFNWLISKRLAFALVVGLGIFGGIYISMMIPEGFFRAESGSVKTYKYRALPLKFYSGEVNILDRHGNVGYRGNVEGGAAEGTGLLYDTNGGLVYEGEFAASMYNGKGTLYYPNGSPHYVGDFTENLYNGAGKYYRSSGVVEYEGNYVTGVRTGEGTLYDSVGNKIFQGNFLNNEILYSDFLDRPTSELSQLYLGAEQMYQSEKEFCVAMPEINALCSVQDGSDTLEEEWKISDVYVLSSSIQMEEGPCITVEQLTRILGKPMYFGTASVSMSEAVALNLLASQDVKGVEAVRLDTDALFQDVMQVSDWDRKAQVYLYSYEKDGQIYTFYTPGAGDSGFFMYSISKA